MKQTIKKALLRSPFEEVARWAYHRLYPSRYTTLNAKYDRETIAVMRRCLTVDSNCVDVGCYKGNILQRILKLAPNGVHYAFEPLPAYYHRLVKAFPNVHSYELALSDVAEETTFQYVVSSPGLSSLRSIEYGPDEHLEQIKVRTELLDNIVPRELSIRFIKIDVEGAELQVLRGAVNTIKKHMPFVVFEHGLGLASYYGTIPEDVYDLLVKDCGLNISLMERWLKNETPLSREEFSSQVYQDLNYYFIAYEG
jgi:FkbM family methyltransferase